MRGLVWAGQRSKAIAKALKSAGFIGSSGSLFVAGGLTPLAGTRKLNAVYMRCSAVGVQGGGDYDGSGVCFCAPLCCHPYSDGSSVIAVRE